MFHHSLGRVNNINQCNYVRLLIPGVAAAAKFLANLIARRVPFSGIGKPFAILVLMFFVDPKNASSIYATARSRSRTGKL